MKKEAENKETYIGKIKYFNDRGFMFIGCDKLPDDIYLHISNVKGETEPIEGMYVRFELGENERGYFAKWARIIKEDEYNDSD